MPVRGQGTERVLPPTVHMWLPRIRPAVVVPKTVQLQREAVAEVPGRAFVGADGVCLRLLSVLEAGGATRATALGYKRVGLHVPNCELFGGRS